MRKILLSKRTVPRWVILLVDQIITCFSFSLSYFVGKYFLFTEILHNHFIFYTVLYCLISVVVFYLMKIHTGLIRYSNIHDMFRIFSALFVISVFYPVAVRLLLGGLFGIDSLDMRKALFINFFIASSLLIFLRTTIKGLYYFLKDISTANVNRVLIYGTDLTSILIKQTLESNQNSNLQIVGFIDSDRQKINANIQQVKVFPVTALQRLKHKSKVDQLILANDKMISKEKQYVIDQCLKLSIKVLTVPPSAQWIYGKLCLTQIKDLKIEDLLQREPIVINNDKIFSELTGKRILITGAAGSIGLEIVRQVIQYKPAMVILCDQAESPLHEIQLEIEEKHPEQDMKVFIGSIQNHERMLSLFKQFHPEIIFHAAAYKHVPMMEHHPTEAILTNVLGTKNLADMAILFEAEKFVMISTDKAVNPTNVMGTTKRIAEMYVGSLNNVQHFDFSDEGGNKADAQIPLSTTLAKHFKTKFITTRFGNVLGSNGSVIPRFYKQIQNGGPVTVTDPEITRYFMTIPEAVQLVLEACTMGHGGEIFVFDMGKPVKIVDLAYNMIKLAGLIPEKDIKIEFTGLRPGEKLYEELLNESEKTIPTHHEKIKIAKVPHCSYYDVLQKVLDIIESCDEGDKYVVVRKMKNMIPEFLSKNSQYEVLDIKPAKETRPQFIADEVST